MLNIQYYILAMVHPIITGAWGRPHRNGPPPPPPPWGLGPPEPQWATAAATVGPGHLIYARKYIK